MLPGDGSSIWTLGSLPNRPSNPLFARSVGSVRSVETSTLFLTNKRTRRSDLNVFLSYGTKTGDFCVRLFYRPTRSGGRVQERVSVLADRRRDSALQCCEHLIPRAQKQTPKQNKRIHRRPVTNLLSIRGIFLLLPREPNISH